MKFLRPLSLLWLLAAAVSLSAANLVPVRVGVVEASDIPVDAAGVTVVGERPVVYGGNSLWVLDLTSRAWSRVDEVDFAVRAAVLDGERALLLVADQPGASAVQTVRVAEAAGARLQTRALPSLPVPLDHAQGAIWNGHLFVAGRSSAGRAHLFSLPLGAAAAGWATHAGWPEGQGAVTSLVVQDQTLFLTLRGRAEAGDALLRWTSEGGWRNARELPGRVVEGTARAIGQGHVLYLVRAVTGSTARLLSLHTVTDAVAVQEELGEREVRSGAAWGTGLAWAEPRGDAQTLVSAELVATQLLLQPWDWVVIIVYLSGMTGIGLYFYLRERKHSTADFFVGGRTIPFWAAGISLYATNTSSISYIAIPAKAFATNWQYLTNNLVAVCGLMFVAVFIVPLLRRLDLMSVFHYLEIRFHPAIRQLTSALCIAMQLGGRMSVVLFLPSLAISTITGLDVLWSILIMGGITIGYTAMGGMKAVIWTDFVQLFVMFGGAIFAIGFIILKLDGGMGEFFTTAAADDKMKLFDWSFDLTKATVWGFVFLVLFDVVLTFPKDQVLMQRVLSTKSSREAGRSIWTFAAIMIPGGFFFYLIGTALFVFYKANPERMNPLLATDATFPLFIAAELPVGVTGLIIAGIFAASMSTLSSIMNSVATLVSVDFYEKLVRNPDPAKSVRFAEWMTVAAGLTGMGLAVLLSRYDINSLFDVSIELSGLLGGGFAGAYTLGMFTRRANWQGVAIGIATSITLTTIAWSQSLVHPYFYLAISIVICISAGYVASLFFPPPTQSLDGLTIFGGGTHQPAAKKS